MHPTLLLHSIFCNPRMGVFSHSFSSRKRLEMPMGKLTSVWLMFSSCVMHSKRQRYSAGWLFDWLDLFCNNMMFTQTSPSNIIFMLRETVLILHKHFKYLSFLNFWPFFSSFSYKSLICNGNFVSTTFGEVSTTDGESIDSAVYFVSNVFPFDSIPLPQLYWRFAW